MNARYLNAGKPHNPSLITLGPRKDLTMANTYTSLNYHLVFSTKDRFPWIGLEIEQRVWSFIGGIARKHQMTAIQVGGVEDHIHALVMAPPTIAPFRLPNF